MPKIYTYGEYVITIWSNENGEPIHVYVSKNRATSNATKLWLLSNGDVEVAHNKSRVPRNDLNEIIDFIRLNHTSIVIFWMAYHGYLKFVR